MEVNSVRFVFVAVCLLATYVHAQQSQVDLKSFPTRDISRTCFGCICEAASGCNTTAICSGEVCGPFRITWSYWSDGGQPTLNNEPSEKPGAYQNCVNDPFCASLAVQGYMNRFAQDCNGDGVINCDDYVRIHRMGGYGCSGYIEPEYENRYRSCVKTYGM